MLYCPGVVPAFRHVLDKAAGRPGTTTRCALPRFLVDIWNSLPDYVVEAVFVNAFKNRLDKYWITGNQDVVYIFIMKSYIKVQKAAP